MGPSSVGSRALWGTERSEGGGQRAEFQLHGCLGHAALSRNFRCLSCLVSFPFLCMRSPFQPPTTVHPPPPTHPPTYAPIPPTLPLPHQFTLCSLSTRPCLYLVLQSPPSLIHPLVHLLSQPSPTHSPSTSHSSAFTHSFLRSTQMSIHSLCIYPETMSSAQERHSQPSLRGFRKGFLN